MNSGFLMHKRGPAFSTGPRLSEFSLSYLSLKCLSMYWARISCIRAGGGITK
jgi:hypothetical protein